MLELEETDKGMSLVADKLIAEQLPGRKNFFMILRQKEILNKINETRESVITRFENRINEPLQRYETVPKNANIREEFVKCRKNNCSDCPHEPYYYTYWRDVNTKRLKKKYPGVIDPRQ